MMPVHTVIMVLQSVSRAISPGRYWKKRKLWLSPDNADAYFYLGSAYAAQDKKQESFTALKRCVELDKTNADAYRLLAAISAAEGKNKDALEYAETAVSLKPDNKNYIATRDKIKMKMTASK
ncbi:MAG: tetratricopeptide repeat protein [Candidatus Obscuribacter sp.]|nr:tetratricopeptide repeat protein [Candidatus Obscuribacter sp.]